MSKPETSVVTTLLDAADDHLHQVSVARTQAARSASRIVSELKTWETALRIIDSHGEYARESIAQVRALRPSIRGRRTDLMEEAA